MRTDSDSRGPRVIRAPAVAGRMSVATGNPRAAAAVGVSVLAVAAGFLAFAVADPRAGAQDPGGDGAKARVALSAHSRVVTWKHERCFLFFIFPVCGTVTDHIRKTKYGMSLDVSIPVEASGVGAYADGTPASLRLEAGAYSRTFDSENFPDRTYGRKSVRFLDRHRHRTLALRWDGDTVRMRARWKDQESDRVDLPDAVILDVVLGGYTRSFDIDLQKRGGRAAGSSALTLLAPPVGEEAGE